MKKITNSGRRSKKRVESLNATLPWQLSAQRRQFITDADVDRDRWEGNQGGGTTTRRKEGEAKNHATSGDF